MPLDTISLRSAAQRQTIRKALSFREALQLRMRTAFLCHSHKDVDLARGLVVMLQEAGWNVYVDWADDTMPDIPDEETAKKIRTKIVETNYFLLLATANSMASRWCPWELGYADGKKELANILVVPTRTGTTTYGSEYLHLYRVIDQTSQGQLGAWFPNNKSGSLVSGL